MPAPLQYLQSSFIRGMNQQVDGSRLAADEYSLLINGRNRYDTIDPITRPVDVTPTGVTKVQGCYAAGALLVCFADGEAFYRNEGLANQTFTQIPGFQMSATVDTLFAVLVPASTVNGVRTLRSASNTSLGVLLSSTSASSPQAMLVQDGVNQPMLIFPDGSVRVTQNYNQWFQASREYVPIGKQMMFNSGVLYIVSVDGLQIYRSVTGRPLDFMVIIDESGNKLPAETDGGASQISHKVDYAPITALAALSSPDGSFYVSTARTSYAVRPVFETTIYGEPVFSNTFLFTTGAVNNFCVADILGDNAIVDYSGIRSFNSVGQYRIEGKNSPFSAKVNRLLTGIRQESPAAVTFDNYALFSVLTVFGGGILVFDTITQQWSSLDLMPSLSGQVIQMFAEVKTSVNRKLFCSTTEKVFELYPEAGRTETPAYYSPEFNSGDPAVSQKSVCLRLTFLDVLTPGTVWVTPVEDGKAGTQRAARLQNVLPDTQAAVPPVLQRGTDKVRVATVPLNDIAKSCWKTGMYIRWNFSGKLAAVKLAANSQVSDVSLEEQVAMSAVNSLFIATGGATEFVAGATLHIFGSGFTDAIKVLLNDTFDVEFVILADGWITVTLPVGWGAGTPPIIIDITTSTGTRFVWVAGIRTANGSGPDRDNEWGFFLDPGTINFFIPAADAAKQIVAVAAQPPSVPPVTVNVPPTTPAASPASGSCPTTFNINNAREFSPGQFVLDTTVAAGGATVFAGLMFMRNSDGSYTYLSPLWSGVIDVTNTSMDQMGDVFTTADSARFVINGRTFCVSFGSKAVTPEPEPEDPCSECTDTRRILVYVPSLSLEYIIEKVDNTHWGTSGVPGTAYITPWIGPGSLAGCPNPNLYGWEIYVAALAGPLSYVSIARSNTETKCPVTEYTKADPAYADVQLSWVV